MKTVEIRRHSIRGEGKALSPFGLQLAREARSSLAGQYTLVVSGPKRRCRETVEAFGFKRYLIEGRLSPLDYRPFREFEKRIEKTRRKRKLSWIEAAFKVPETVPLLREAAKEALKTVGDIASFLGEDERALAVTHGDFPELAALLAFPSFDLKHLGRPLSFCEGVALRFEGEKLVLADVLRLAAPPAVRVPAPRPEPVSA
jgi:broad specificity phosphatase PhoE